MAKQIKNCVFELMKDFEDSHYNIMEAFKETPNLSKKTFIELLPVHLKTKALQQYINDDIAGNMINHAKYVKFLQY